MVLLGVFFHFPYIQKITDVILDFSLLFFYDVKYILMEDLFLLKRSGWKGFWDKVTKSNKIYSQFYSI